MNTSLTNIGSNPESGTLIAEPQTHYPAPSPELIDDIRQRIAEVPHEILQRVHDALMHRPIQEAASLLWKAGVCLSTSELYEYRKTLFPPGALVDPLTNDAPILRDQNADSPSAGDSISPGRASGNGPLTTDNGLLSDLRSILSRYVVLPEMAAEALSLWVVHTYAFTLRQVTTYIGVVSPEKRCGKTTLLELLGLLANRALTASNISPSALFRVIEETQPTLLIDEADTFLQSRDELAGILNAGYRKNNSYVVRVGDRKPRHQPGGTSYTGPQSTPAPEFGEWTVDDSASIHSNSEPGTLNAERSGLVRYSCWCPTVMAAIGRLPDTLADRCIVITMQRKLAGEKCERLRQLNATDLRKRCAEFVCRNATEIADAQPGIPSALHDRAADIWEPLFAIADLAGGEWPQLARDAAQKLSAREDDLTLIGYFLKDLRNLMVITNVDRMLSRDIVSAFNPMHNRPWEDLRRGREINEWWLGRLLSELGLHSRTMRVNDAMGKGFMLADIESAFRRYVPNPELHTPSPDDAPDRLKP